MKTPSINIGFILFLFQIYNANLLKASRTINSRNPNQIQQNTTIFPMTPQSSNNNCNPFLNSVDIKSIVSKVVKESSSFPSKRYFLFFFDNSTAYSRLKEFGTEMSQLFPEVINMSFYCQTIDLQNYTRTQVIGVLNETIIENKKMESLTYEYLQFLMNTFNLKALFHDHVKRANRTMSSMKSKRYSLFLEECCGGDELRPVGMSETNQRRLKATNLNEMEAQLTDNAKTVLIHKEADHRISRLLWSLLIVIIVSLSMFFLVKYSIDWATSSKTEINKQKDQRLREIAEILTSKTSSLDN